MAPPPDDHAPRAPLSAAESARNVSRIAVLRTPTRTESGDLGAHAPRRRARTRRMRWTLRAIVPIVLALIIWLATSVARHGATAPAPSAAPTHPARR